MESRFLCRPLALGVLLLALAQVQVQVRAAVPGVPSAGEEDSWADLPPNLRVVLERTRPLDVPRGTRLPLWVLPIQDALARVPDARAEQALRALDRRGIGYTVSLDPAAVETSATEAVRIGRLQRRLGLELGLDATRCLQFFDGSEQTLHVDASGARFAETSFGGSLGCPFALEHRFPMVTARVDAFMDRIRKAGLQPRLVFADWEVDGPIEWNDAWASSRRCRRCREAVPDLDEFRRFQRALRALRSRMQKETFADRVTRAFPGVLVGNYGVYPHDGHRYWYDYFEREAEGVPYRSEQRARYREWAHEFGGTGYTFAMPVVYTWYRIHGWYDFPDSDDRWFHNLLLTGSNPARHTPAGVPLITFVHWATTAPPDQPDPRVVPFSEARYRDLLWHLLLRGHDTFFLWCLPEELAKEIAPVHRVYAESLAHAGFFEHGEPVTFDVPNPPGPAVSGLRWGDRVLVRRTESASAPGAGPLTLAVPGGGRLRVPAADGVRVLDLDPPAARAGMLRAGGAWRFPIGSYHLPASDDALRELAASGVNLVRCTSRADLDRARAAGLMGWVPVPVDQGPTEALDRLVREVADHPALAVWEGPDEVVWNFTAYSGLERTAGFGRREWRNQAPKAVAHARTEGERIMPLLREGIRRVRELDPRGRPFWINEAADSDAGWVRRYLDDVDVTGCDYYPVRGDGTDLAGVGRLVDRWHAVGRGRPVWMVLQGFSWHTLRPDRARRYPSFEESRWMAYDALVHGARGILYWGTERIEDPAFRESLAAVTSELAALEPALAGDGSRELETRVLDEVQDPPGRGVKARLWKAGNEGVVVLVNEDPFPRTGVDLAGLEAFEGRTWQLLDGEEPVRVTRGGWFTRLPAHGVKVWSTEPGWTTSRRAGRGGGRPSE